MLDREVESGGQQSAFDEDSLETPHRQDEAVRVRDWRRLIATELGCTEFAAEYVSSLEAWDLDLHDLADLVGRGCNSDLAVEVLR
jgi:hypothetical protein